MPVMVPIGPTAEAGACPNLNMNNKENLFVQYYLNSWTGALTETSILPRMGHIIGLDLPI